MSRRNAIEIFNTNRPAVIEYLTKEYNQWRLLDEESIIGQLKNALINKFVADWLCKITDDQINYILNDVMNDVIAYSKQLAEEYTRRKEVKRIAVEKHRQELEHEQYLKLKDMVEQKVLHKALYNKTYYTIDRLTKLIPEIAKLNNEDIEELYTMYDDQYRVKNAESLQLSKPSKPRAKPPKPPKPKTLKIDIQNDIPKDVINSINATGFKSPHKVLKIVRELYPDSKINIDDVKSKLTLPTNSFPLKDNKKRYSLHVVAPIGTYIIDLMFVSGFVYLIAINVNTRKAYARSTTKYTTDTEANTLILDKQGEKSIKNILDALIYLICYTDFKPKIIRGDGEKAFNSNFIKRWFEREHIKFIHVRRLMLNNMAPFEYAEKTSNNNDPQHGSLSIIDRFIRTIRDMAYNMKIKNITPDVMDILVRNYNMAPHKHLTKYLGEPTSPNDMDEDREKYIIRKICQENYNIRNQALYHLPSGMSVDVYNEKDSMFKRRSKKRYGNYHVVDYKGGLYNVRDGDNDIWVPRYMIAPRIR